MLHRARMGLAGVALKGIGLENSKR